jgi:hypothetical protein
MDVFRTIIVPADNVEAFRTQAATVPGGEGMFITPLSPTGQEPATHYISSGFIPAIELPVQGRADTSDEPPFDAMARLGLQLVTPEEEA